jgi:ectoine hydroxylase-related dioxygenase (phytanoyl-CoA dioxygenase family)
MNLDGYEIKRDFIDVSAILDYALERAKKAEPIFNGKCKLRRQIVLPVTKWVQELKDKLQFGEYIVRNFVVLQSLPGCQEQEAHCDYVPTPNLLATTDETVPLLFFLALEDDTTLEVWPRSHKVVRGKLEVIHKQQIKLNKGDAVFFRADLVHAGSAYFKSNTRIHCYLDHPSVRRDPNRTWIIQKHSDIKEYIR